jgi:hypothetical protein
MKILNYFIFYLNIIIYIVANFYFELTFFENNPKLYIYMLQTSYLFMKVHYNFLSNDFLNIRI